MVKDKIVGSPRQSPISFSVIMGVVAVCLLGWLISVFHLSYESMWIDEAQTLTTSSQGILQIVQTIAKDVHPPIYFLWVHFWLAFIGSDDLFILRLSSAIPGLISVALCYRLAWEWFESRIVALGAASFLATSGLFIYYTRDLRMYPLMVMMTLSTWWMLTRYLKGKTRARWGYAASLVLLAYTFYFAAFMVIAQWLVVFIFFRARIGKLLKACAIMALALVPWIPTFLTQIYEARAQSGDPNAPLIGKFLGTTPTSIGAIWEFIQTYTAKQPGYILLLIVLALLWGLQNMQYRRWIVASALWLFLTISLFFAINLIFPIYGIRYVLSVLPALAILAGAAFAILPKNRIIYGVIVVVLVNGMISQTDGFLPARAPHRELLSTIAAHYLPTDRVWYDLNQGALGSTYTDDVKYHLRKNAPMLNPDLFVWNAPQEFLDVKASPRVWDVRPYWITPPSAILAALQNGRVVTEVQTFDAYAVKLYEAPPLAKAPVELGDFFDLLVSPQEVTIYQPDQLVDLKTWWHVRQAIPTDYSLSLILLAPNSSKPAAQQDTPLLIDTKPTSKLLPGDHYIYQSQTFHLPKTLKPGSYTIWLTVYYYGDLKRLAVSASPDFVTDNALSTVQIGEIAVIAQK